MYRALCILWMVASGILVSVDALSQEATYTNIAQEIQNAKDVEAVRMVIMREIEGFFKGDPEQVFSCYAPEGFFGISVMGDPDPKTWQLAVTTPEDVRVYADQAKTKMETRYPGLTHRAEIQHAQVRGSYALAVARQWLTIPDKQNATAENREFESVFILKKFPAGWKIISFIGGIDSEREVSSR